MWIEHDQPDARRRDGEPLPVVQRVFLDRADLADLVEAENDWHRHTGPLTEPLPRITADMTAPPPSRPKARSYIETLFD